MDKMAGFFSFHVCLVIFQRFVLAVVAAAPGLEWMVDSVI